MNGEKWGRKLSTFDIFWWRKILKSSTVASSSSFVSPKLDLSRLLHQQRSFFFSSSWCSFLKAPLCLSKTFSSNLLQKLPRQSTKSNTNQEILLRSHGKERGKKWPRTWEILKAIFSFSPPFKLWCTWHWVLTCVYNTLSRMRRRMSHTSLRSYKQSIFVQTQTFVL